MILFPAIDLYEGCVVRLFKGDYAQKTVYSTDPPGVAKGFRTADAEWLHVVDLEGARSGTTPNLETVKKLVRESGLKVELGGGIRSQKTIETYLDIGVSRVILGTAAVTQSGFVEEMVEQFGDQIAVGVDLRDGLVAIRGWTEVTDLSGMDFCRRMEELGVQTVICTDISKDGVLGGPSAALYKEMSETLSLDIIASGGVTTLEDIRELMGLGLYGAILGKTLYEGKLDLSAACALVRAEGGNA